MGGSSYSDDAASRLYSSRSSTADSIGKTAAANAVFVNKSAAAVKASGMDPALIKTREARDSDAHPESNAIGIFFDVTGSMGDIPRHLALDANKLPGLMRLITTNGYIKDPQIMYGAIGDGYSDQAPIQVGQFESGLEQDEWLTKLFIEGNGGGQRCESYELAYQWAANHVSMDCFEKRGKKGYLFTMGDEMAYKELPAAMAKKWLGDDIEGSLSLREILDRVQEKFEVFHIYINQGGYPDKPEHLEFWKGYLGERFLKLDNVDHIAELIGSTIGVCEGRGLSDVAADLAKAGLSHDAGVSVTKAIVPFATISDRGLSRVGTSSGGLAPMAAAGASKRL